MPFALSIGSLVIFHVRSGAAVTNSLMTLSRAASDAMIFWGTQSNTVPLRPDGKPNKPLTALSIEVEPAP